MVVDTSATSDGHSEGKPGSVEHVMPLEEGANVGGAAAAMTKWETGIVLQMEFLLDPQKKAPLLSNPGGGVPSVLGFLPKSRHLPGDPFLGPDWVLPKYLLRVPG